MIWPFKILQNCRFERSLFTLRDPAPLNASLKVFIKISSFMRVSTVLRISRDILFDNVKHTWEAKSVSYERKRDQD